MTHKKNEIITLSQNCTKTNLEYNNEIGLREYFSLRQRLRVVCRPDPHGDAGGEYLITSLYFDNCYDKALREKRHGTDRREKFRFRYYRRQRYNAAIWTSAVNATQKGRQTPNMESIGVPHAAVFSIRSSLSI